MSFWSEEDKEHLLELLQRHGASNLNVIQKHMPHKTISEIKCICDKHARLAMNKWHSFQGTKSEDQTLRWIQILQHICTTQTEGTQDIIARTLKYIALYEKRTTTSHIDLRDCYLVLSDISNGIAAKKLDECTNYFLFECLTKLAESLKKGETGSYKRNLRSLKDVYDIIRSHELENDENNSLVINPLNIPNNLLVMTELDKKADIFE